MNEDVKFDVWITRYALTSGVEKARANRCSRTPGMIAVRRGIATVYFHGKDWHETEKAALARANNMRLKKIAALGKQIAKLQKLDPVMAERYHPHDTRKILRSIEVIHSTKLNMVMKSHSQICLSTGKQHSQLLQSQKIESRSNYRLEKT